jgi:hypothetical protein
VSRGCCCNFRCTRRYSAGCRATKAALRWLWLLHRPSCCVYTGTHHTAC